MALIATVVEWGELGQTVIAATIAGVGITMIFSLAILGVARFVDLRRDARPFAAAIALALSSIALAAFVIAIVVGLIVMTQ